MQFFDKDLILIRLKSFGYSAGSFLLVALVGALASDEFRAIVTEHLGSGAFSAIGLLVFDGLIKHLRNLKISQNVGAASSKTLI